MRENLDEIKNVIDKHGYSINNIICDVMKKFKFKTLCHQSGFSKEQGYSVPEIITLLIMLPLMLLDSVNSFYKSEYQDVSEMKKDVIYRLKNSEKMPWRRLLYSVVKMFQQRVAYKKEVAHNSALIVDDTIDQRVGYKIENISLVHNHAGARKGTGNGFKHLVLGFFDGKSISPLDFSSHTEKALPRKKLKKQYHKKCAKNSNGYKRRKECKDDKITSSIKHIKRAVKNGFIAKYVLADSWFTSFDFIKSVREIKDGAMHVVAGIRNDFRKYFYKGVDLNGKEILTKLKSESTQKRCRRWNTRYYEVIVNYEGIGDVKLYYCRFPYQKKWRLFISTDTSLGFVKMMEIYSVRWTIEVMFKELKQFLQFGKCKSRDFDAQIASITISMILYVFISYFRRMNAYESIGGLFELIKDDLCEKNLAQRLWELFDELLSIVIEAISESGIVDILTFKNSSEYSHIKELFEHSFLSNQMLDLDMSA